MVRIKTSLFVCLFEGQEMFISEQVLLKKRHTRPPYDESLGVDTLRAERKGRQVEVMPRRILTEEQQRLKCIWR
jgi:hypothetical protein